MKKIGQVCHQFLPHIGGIENHVNDITEFINEKGHEACVLTTDFDTSVSIENPGQCILRQHFHL